MRAAAAQEVASGYSDRSAAGMEGAAQANDAGNAAGIAPARQHIAHATTAIACLLPYIRSVAGWLLRAWRACACLHVRSLLSVHLAVSSFSLLAQLFVLSDSHGDRAVPVSSRTVTEVGGKKVQRRSAVLHRLGNISNKENAADQYTRVRCALRSEQQPHIMFERCWCVAGHLCFRTGSSRRCQCLNCHFSKWAQSPFVQSTPFDAPRPELFPEASSLL